MRRTLIICLSIFALVGVAWGVLAVVAPGPAPTVSDELAQSPATTTTPSAPVAWNGAGDQLLDTTFLVSGHQIIVKRFSFGGLTRPRAAVEAKLLVLPSQPGKVAWLQNAFRMNSASATFNPAAVKVTRSGSAYAVSVRFAKIPSAQLHGGIAFSITYPAASVIGRAPGPRSISVAPLAPFPPA